MPEVTERTLHVGGSRLHVREVGEGPPMIVLHGGPDFDHEYLLPELDELAGRLRLVYYDQRGRGRSYTGETAGDVTIASEMEDLDHVRDAVGLPAVALLGHSFGCLLATEYAIRHPERVSHLILLNTAPLSHAGVERLRADLAKRRTRAEAARMRELAADPAFRRGEIAAEAEYYRIHIRPALREPAQVDAVVRRLRRRFTAAGIIAAREIEASLYEQTWDREDYDLLPRLRALHMPALVIHGDRDLIPVEIARDIADAFPNGRFVVLEDCGHFAYLEQPAAVRGAIEDLVAPTVAQSL